MNYLFIFPCLFAAVWTVDVPCGVPVVQPINSRIVGGVTAKQGSWPWMVMMVDFLGRIRGSGAILHPNVILTSAQHFRSILDTSLHLWRVYAGKHNISTTDVHEQYYHIRRGWIHHDYDPATLQNDLALLITVEPIQWNDHTRPICLPDATHSYTVGDLCYLAGWGNTASTGEEEVLNQLVYPILDDSVCNNTYPDYAPATEICAGYQQGHKDFCADDIGSPLVCKHSSGAWFAQGLAAGGGDCTKDSKPGMFEDLMHYSDWIKKLMEAAGYPYQY